MENKNPNQKRNILTKKLNEYTSQATPGQKTKLSRDEIRHYFNVYLARDPHAGESGTVDEYKIYEFHPDNKQLMKDLSVLKKRDDRALKEADDEKKATEQGQGGPGIGNFGGELASGALNVNQRVNSMMAPVQTSFVPQSSPMTGQASTNVGGKVRGREVVKDLARTPLPEQYRNLGTITTNYGESTAYEPFHPALDIANKEGTPIPEFKGGVVTEVGNQKGYGNYIKVKDAQGNIQRYSHLKQALVQPGQQVSAGQQIALMGRTGNVYSQHGGDPSHLDYEVVNAYNQLINPLTYLNQ